MAVKPIPPFMPPTDLMDLSSACAYLSKSRPWVYRAMRELNLPAIRLGKRWAFRKSSLDIWLADQPGVNLPTAS